MDHELLTRLLKGEHVNMPERIALGAWPHSPLEFQDLVGHLAEILRSEKWFPREWKVHEEGSTVNEGMVIERSPIGKYVVRARRAHPTVPTLLAEATQKTFSTPEEAARYFLRWNLKLPGDLDGWKVV
ncbi:MAG: hypothetical protein HQ567_31450 [Candidatus Nealsonbacteria bacterium]|nr:hypothetical protein [Candidatus Nealsonbacteria bacterium]